MELENEKEFAIKFTGWIPPVVQSDAKRLLEILLKEDSLFAPNNISLDRSLYSDRYGKECVSYTLQFQVEKMLPIPQGSPIEYLQRRTGFRVKIGWARPPHFPCNFFTFTMRDIKLITDLEDQIKDLQEKFNNIWFHPLMPGGMEQIEKAKRHFE